MTRKNFETQTEAFVFGQPSSLASKTKQASRLYAITLAVCMILAVTGHQGFAADPEWSNNQIGREPIVLPDFEPLTLMGSTIELGAQRTYQWTEQSLLPQSINIRAKPFIRNMGFHAQIDGTWHELTALTPAQMQNNDGHDIQVIGIGQSGANLRFTVSASIEYDGFAQISLELHPDTPVKINRLQFRATISAGEGARTLQFEADTIRRRKKQFVFPDEYSGPSINALGIADGARSFWWIADTGSGRINGAIPAFQLRRTSPAELEFSDLIIQDTTLNSSHQISLNFLVTPVKPGAAWRDNHVGLNTSAAEQSQANIHLWWIDAFAHETLPYMALPRDAERRLPASDIELPRDAKYANKRIAAAKRNGIDLIPYFSAHALSALDPAANQFGKVWAVHPPYVIPGSNDGPYTSSLKRPWFSHRSAEYSNYLLYRFSALMDEVDFQGLYFDQGGPIDSRNPNHAWSDSDSRLQPATDIIALRSFFKRLATLFYLKGRDGRIYVHNSSSPVVPAYTFITAMVQGEEYKQRLDRADYLSHLNLPELQSAYSPSQYGIGSIWLSVLWSKKVRPVSFQSTRDWLATPQYKRASETYHGLALVHDISTWSYASSELREQVAGIRRALAQNGALFKGYWTADDYTASEPLLVSHYVAEPRSTIFTAMVNTSTRVKEFELENIGNQFTCGHHPPVSMVPLAGQAPHFVNGRVHGALNPGSFSVFQTRFQSPAPTECVIDPNSVAR